MLQCVQSLIEGSRRDDGSVELRRAVEVVVVGVEPGLAQAERLLRREHAQGHTGLEPFGLCLLYTSPSPRDRTRYRMPSSA